MLSHLNPPRNDGWQSWNFSKQPITNLFSERIQRKQVRAIAFACEVLHQNLRLLQHGAIPTQGKRQKFFNHGVHLSIRFLVIQPELQLPCLQLAVHRKRSDESLLQMLHLMNQQRQRSWVGGIGRQRIIFRVQMNGPQRRPKRADVFPRLPKTDIRFPRPQIRRGDPPLLPKFLKRKQQVLVPSRARHF